MPSEKFFVHKEDGSLVRLKGRLVRFLDEEPPTGSDKSAIRTALEVSPDAEGLVQADIGTDPNQLVLHQHLGDISYQSADSVSVAELEVESTTGTATTQALTVTDGSSTKFVVQEDGKVGVGGIPNYALDVSAGSVSLDSDWPLYFGSSNAFIEGGTSGTKLRLNHSAGLNVTNAGTTHLAVDSSGNVSVGGTTFAAGKLRVEDNNGNHVWLKGRSSDGNSSVSFRNNADSAYNGRIAVDDSTGMNFQVAGSTRWTINTTGNLVAGANLGIDFGSGGASSVLDDYERGTATPTDASGAGLTLAGVGINYVKIGSQVTAWVTVTYPTTSDTSTARIGNLPFAIGSSDIDRIGGFVASQSTGLSVSVLGTTGTGQVTFRKSDGSPYANSELSGKFIWFCFIYDVS